MQSYPLNYIFQADATFYCKGNKTAAMLKVSIGPERAQRRKILFWLIAR